MKTIKEIFIVLFCVVMILLMFATFLAPVIISAVTGNWWYLFLFFVVGIPILVEWIIILLVVDIFMRSI